MASLGTLVFDMDGTLVDAMSQHADAFSEILFRKYGVPRASSRHLYLDTAGQPLDEQFIQALVASKGLHASKANLDELLEQFWVAVLSKEPVLFPDVPSALERLWRAGYSLVVISGCSPLVVETKMRKAGIDGYFKLMLGTDKKRHLMSKGEGHFRLIREKLRLSSSEFHSNTAIIGDGKHDMIIGNKANILTIGRTTDDNRDALQKGGADFLVHDLGELWCTPLSRPRGGIF
jgi:phosphoglycolate phosphatase